MNSLDKIIVKGNRIKMLSLAIADIYSDLEELSSSYTKKEKNAMESLAFETNRVIERLEEINRIILDYSADIVTVALDLDEVSKNETE